MLVLLAIYYIIPSLSFSGNWTAIIYGLKNPAPEKEALLDLLNAEIYLAETGKNIYTDKEYRLQKRHIEISNVHYELENILPQYVTYGGEFDSNNRKDIINILPNGQKYKNLIIKTARTPCKSKIYLHPPEKYTSFQGYLSFGGIQTFTSCRTNAYEITPLSNGNLSVTYRRPWF